VEEMKMYADYKNPLMAGLTYYAEWLYSENQKLASPGRYYLVTWLTDRTTGAFSTGKFDLTLAPWTWMKYADASTTAQVQSQGSTCQCSFNALEFREMNLERLSSLPPEALSAALPKRSCPSEVDTTSVCHAAANKFQLSPDTEIEWSGQYELMPGSTYSWTFYAQQHCKNTLCTLQYPDPAIDVLFAASDALGSDPDSRADAILKANKSNTVLPGAKVDLTGERKTTLQFNSVDPSSQSTISEYLVEIATGASSQWLAYTQHVPHEFSAQFLRCVSGACASSGSSAQFVFPRSTTLYVERTNSGVSQANDAANRAGPGHSWARSILTSLFICSWF